jgi:transposase
MANFTRILLEIIIGLDLGDKFSYYFVLDSKGERLDEGRIKTSPEAFKESFGKLKPSRVALEVGTHSPWASRVIKECGHEVLVANSRQFHLIYKNPKKTDRIDAQNLARVARMDPELLKPIQHRGLKAQRFGAILRARESLVKSRGVLINHVRGAVKSFGGRIRCTAHAFHLQAEEQIPEEVRRILKPLLETISQITDQIKLYDKNIQRAGEEHFPDAARLRQVKGVGPILSLAYVLCLEDPKRFTRSRTVGAYLGLTPRKDQSGESDPQLRISKCGDKSVRRLLVGSAQYILGPFGPDTDLRRHGERIIKGGGKKAKKRAVIAVARKLAVLLHRLWVSGEDYEPLRNAKRQGTTPVSPSGAESSFEAK